MRSRIEIEFPSFESAFRGAFGLDTGSIVIVQHVDDKWILTNYRGVKRPGTFLVVDPGSESDSAWLGQK